MQPTLSTRIPDGFMAALCLEDEKPHQGVRSSNPAPYRGHNRCKLRTALGLRAGCAGNRVRSFYRGEQYDPDLGLYYLRARYMNPVTGRFLSRDPLDGVPTDPATLHKYIFANGDPVDLSDPLGMNAMPVPVPPLPGPEPVPPPSPKPSQTRGGGLEYGLIIGTIALTEVAAEAALACRINISLAEDALKVQGDTDVTEDLRHCSAKGKSCKTQYPQYIPLNQLWYPFTNEFAAFQDAVANNGGKQPRKGLLAPATDGPCGEGSGYVVGTHQNLLSGGQHVGDIVSCTACDDSSGDPTLTKRWDYIP